MVVKRGDVEVGRAQWGSALPIDPGKVIVEASGRGYKTWRAAVAVSPRGSAQIEIPALEPAPVVVPTGASQPSSVDPHATSEPGQQPFGAQRMVAVVIGATGIVALGVGTVFGLVSISKKSAASKNHCDASNVCDDQGLTLRHDAIKAGNFSSVGFVAGGVLAAAGVILWFTAPSRHQAVRGSAVVPRAGFALLWCGAAFAMELP